MSRNTPKTYGRKRPSLGGSTTSAALFDAVAAEVSSPPSQSSPSVDKFFYPARGRSQASSPVKRKASPSARPHQSNSRKSQPASPLTRQQAAKRRRREPKARQTTPVSPQQSRRKPETTSVKPETTSRSTPKTSPASKGFGRQTRSAKSTQEFSENDPSEPMLSPFFTRRRASASDVSFETTPSPIRRRLGRVADHTKSQVQNSSSRGDNKRRKQDEQSHARLDSAADQPTAQSVTPSKAKASSSPSKAKASSSSSSPSKAKASSSPSKARKVTKRYTRKRENHKVQTVQPGTATSHGQDQHTHSLDLADTASATEQATANFEPSQDQVGMQPGPRHLPAVAATATDGDQTRVRSPHKNAEGDTTTTSKKNDNKDGLVSPKAPTFKADKRHSPTTGKASSATRKRRATTKDSAPILQDSLLANDDFSLEQASSSAGYALSPLSPSQTPPSSSAQRRASRPSAQRRTTNSDPVPLEEVPLRRTISGTTADSSEPRRRAIWEEEQVAGFDVRCLDFTAEMTDAFASREAGKNQKTTDEVAYLLEGLGGSDDVQLGSLLALAALATKKDSLAYFRAYDVVPSVLKRLSRTCLQNQATRLAIATLCYVTRGDTLREAVKASCSLGRGALLVLLKDLSEPLKAEESQMMTSTASKSTAGQGRKRSVFGKRFKTPATRADQISHATLQRVRSIIAYAGYPVDNDRPVTASELALETLAAVIQPVKGAPTVLLQKAFREHGIIEACVQGLRKHAGRLSPVEKLPLHLKREICTYMRVFQGCMFQCQQNQNILEAYEGGSPVLALESLVVVFARLLSRGIMASNQPSRADVAADRASRGGKRLSLSRKKTVQQSNRGNGDTREDETTVVRFTELFDEALRTLLSLTHDNRSACLTVGSTRIPETVLQVVAFYAKQLPASLAHDTLSLSFSLLVNLVEHTPENRQRLGSLTISPKRSLSQNGDSNAEQLDQDPVSVIPLVSRLASQFSKTGESDTAEQQTSKKIVAAYAGLFLGCLCANHRENELELRRLLGADELGHLVRHLKEFVIFQRKAGFNRRVDLSNVASVIDVLENCFDRESQSQISDGHEDSSHGDASVLA